MWNITDSPMWELGTFDLGRPALLTDKDLVNPDGFNSTYEADRFCEVAPLARFTKFVESRLEFPYHRLNRGETSRPDIMRCPAHHGSVYAPYDRGDTTSAWHTDGTEWDRLTDYLIVWSNDLGTDIQDSWTKKVYETKPGKVYAFSNGRFLHKAPKNRPLTKPAKQVRWFGRTNVRAISRVRDLPDVFALDL